MELHQIVQNAVEHGASDILLSTDQPLAMRIMGRIDTLNFTPNANEVHQYIEHLLGEQHRQSRPTDFSRDLPNLPVRLRINLSRDRRGPAAIIRLIPNMIPSSIELGIPDLFIDTVTAAQPGLILISGPTDAGKSTTIAAAINEAHIERALHTVTIEDPIEYLLTPQKGVIHQYPFNRSQFPEAVMNTLRQVPDIIMLGEIRTAGEMQAALDAAESGHLVITTVHARSAAEACARIVNTLPDRQAAAAQLSSSLRMSLYQRLVPGLHNRRVMLHELLVNNTAASNNIHEMEFRKLANLTSSNGGHTSLQQSVEKNRALIHPEVYAALIARFAAQANTPAPAGRY